MQGLINMTCNSTKVVRGTDIKKEKVERKQKIDAEIDNLKLALK